MPLAIQSDSDSPVIDPGIPIVDAHHHLFVRPNRKYLFENYLEDTKIGHNIVASTYVETQTFARTDGPELLRPLGEVNFANAVGVLSDTGAYGRSRICAAIVGHADMRAGDSIAELLDRALELAPDRFRGVRQMTLDFPSEEPYRYMATRPVLGVLQNPNFPLAFRHLAKRSLTFDAAVFHTQLPTIAKLAADFPDTNIVLNHMGTAVGLGLDADGRAEVFRDWSAKLREVARHSNVFCKVGGLGMPFWGFGFESRPERPRYLELATAWTPYVETAIEAFGANRCMMESNFPPDMVSCDFRELWNALKHIVRSYSDTDKAALFQGTAARTYRIDIGARAT